MESNYSICQRGRGSGDRAYPFESQIAHAPTLYFNQRFMLVGGSDGSTYYSRIAAYDPSNDKWSSEGQLLTPRDSPGVIPVADSSLIIIGGYMYSDDRWSTEKCEYILYVDYGNQLECSYQEPTQPFSNFYYFEGKKLN